MPTRTLFLFCAGIYTFVYAAALVADTDDTDQKLNVAGWFSWHAIFLFVVAATAEQLRDDIIAAIVHFIGSACATLQSLGFCIWAIVLWARQSAQFYSLMAAVLAVQTAVGAILTVLSIRNMMVAHGARRRLASQ